MAEKKKNAPVQKFRLGGLQLDVWENESEKGQFLTMSFQRSYKDKDGEWQHTQSLRVNDLPVLSLLCQKAFEYAKEKKVEEAA